MSDSKLPSEIDRIVGQRVRWRRRELKITQEKLGDLLDLTFQQVQKYEKGINRISAGRLFELASVLGVPVSYFYDGAEDHIGRQRLSFRETDAPIGGTVESPDALELMTAFQKIPDPGLRRSILATVQATTQIVAS